MRRAGGRRDAPPAAGWRELVMPYILNRSKGGSASRPAKAAEPAASAAPAGKTRKLPIPDLPRRVWIGGGIAVFVIAVAWMWFMFGVGPEDSASIANQASSATPAPPTAPAAAN